MESIFHEKQEGHLCAQHCLNAVLQGPYFNAVDLAVFGRRMDEEERLRMAECGEDSEDYQQFRNQPSGNMDDSGYFSVQVISSALKVFGLELIPYNSTESTAILAQNDPSLMKAYICNYKGHWFTIRKFGNQWFNLNSMLNGPELISNTYLAIYLAQLIQEGYSIFIVSGTFPPCPADDVLLKNPVPIVFKNKNNSKDERSMSKGYRLGTKAEDDAKVLKTALAMGEIQVPTCSTYSTDESNCVTLSQKETSTSDPRERIIPIRLEGRENSNDDEEENIQLQKALKLSLQECDNSIDNSLQLRFDLHSGQTTHSNSIENSDEDEELRKALKLSLECASAPPTPDPEDLRYHRLAYFNAFPRESNNETSTEMNS